jgi:hypothetical protein
MNSKNSVVQKHTIRETNPNHESYNFEPKDGKLCASLARFAQNSCLRTRTKHRVSFRV